MGTEETSFNPAFTLQLIRAFNPTNNKYGINTRQARIAVKNVLAEQTMTEKGKERKDVNKDNTKVSLYRLAEEILKQQTGLDSAQKTESIKSVESSSTETKREEEEEKEEENPWK